MNNLKFTENDDHHFEFNVLARPEPIRSKLWITPKPGGLALHLHCQKPNWWVRMWQWLILGFVWEDV